VLLSTPFNGLCMMPKKPVAFILIFAGLVLCFVLVMQPLGVVRFQANLDLLFAKGQIAIKQRDLLFIIQAIMLLVVIPVYILTFIFSWVYREHNTKAKYTPDWDDNRLAEYLWWGIPCVLTIIVGVLTWIRTYELDPYKPIASEKKPIRIQVVALQWKWLFIYPEENIATVNFLQFPEKTPISFEITADAPMNSFWIPALGGQIYAMPCMRTKLHLIADEAGEYRGSSANLSGVGFAGMHFIAKASTDEEYAQWLESVKQTPQSMSIVEYKHLALPSSDNPVALYNLQAEDLFDKIIMKFMHPMGMKE
jgi:cytochrome o ubiquinol oxidase subunit II